MYRIIDGRGTGKTGRLFILAKENEGSKIVCSNPSALKVKAYSYGFSGIDFISYSEFLETPYHEKAQNKYFIDELDLFLDHLAGRSIIGYNISVE